MRYLVSIFLLTLQLFATMILNLDVKQQKNRVELLLHFDTPYTSPIIKKRSKDRIDIFLKRVKILAKWQKKLSSTILYQIEAKPIGNSTQISFYTINNPRLFAARSKDGMSLKIVLKNPISSQAKVTKEEPLFDSETLLWGSLVFALFIVLLFLSRFLKQPPQKVQTSKRIMVHPHDIGSFRILFEKSLDKHNKIALISYKGINYLVLIGSTNLLLGKYKEGEIESHEDFERVIQEQNLEQAMEPHAEDTFFTTIEEYKRRASGDF